MRLCLVGTPRSVEMRLIACNMVQENDDVLCLSTDFPDDSRLDLRTACVIPRLASAKSDLDAWWLGKRHLLSAIRVCKNELHRFRPQLTYCLGSFPAGFLASFCETGLLVVSPAAPVTVPPVGKLQNWLMERMIRRAMHSADLLVGEGEEAAWMIRDLLDCERSLQPVS